MEINPFFSPLWNKTLPIFLLLLCCTSTENGLSFCKLSCILQSQHCYSSHATAANLGCQVKHDVETEKQPQRSTSSRTVNGFVDQKQHFELHLEMKQRAAKSPERGCKDGKEERWRGRRSHPRLLRLLQVGSEHIGYDWEQLQAEPSAALPIHSRWWIWCRLTGRKIYFWGEKQLLLEARQWSWTDTTWA